MWTKSLEYGQHQPASQEQVDLLREALNSRLEGKHNSVIT